MLRILRQKLQLLNIVFFCTGYFFANCKKSLFIPKRTSCLIECWNRCQPMEAVLFFSFSLINEKKVTISFGAEYNYVGYINVAIMCNYVCTLDFLCCSTFLLLGHIFSFPPFFFFLLLPSVLLVLTSSKLEGWVATALCSPFPSEEALECSPSHSLPAQCCIHINSYQSSSCIQMLCAAQYRLH